MRTFKIETKVQPNIFNSLINSCKMESLTFGRYGAVIVQPTEDGSIPIVRTTTKYNNPVQKFGDIHNELVGLISASIGEKISSNNALVELYNYDYKKMRYHSDQALDLQEESFICIYSCYAYENRPASRKLLVMDKESKERPKEILLEHNSVVVFSVEDNSKMLHKIIYNEIKRPRGQMFVPDGSDECNKWLGITFRMSKTFVKHINGIPFLMRTVGEPRELKLADDEETGKIYSYRSKENREILFKWPEIDYTLSPSDLKVLCD